MTYCCFSLVCFCASVCWCLCMVTLLLWKWMNIYTILEVAGLDKKQPWQLRGHWDYFNIVTHWILFASVLYWFVLTDGRFSPKNVPVTFAFYIFLFPVKFIWMTYFFHIHFTGAGELANENWWWWMKSVEARPLVGVNALSLLQWFDTVGRVTGRTSSPYKPVPLIHKGCVPEQVEGRISRKGDLDFGKRPLTRRYVVNKYFSALAYLRSVCAFLSGHLAVELLLNVR